MEPVVTYLPRDAWPDGREAAGFRLEGDAYAPIEPDADGFFPSRVLDASLRLVPAALRAP